MKKDGNNKEKEKEIVGRVEETLPNTLFRVTVEETNERVLAYLSGKMRVNRIKVLVGDNVRLALDPHGGKARITMRL